MKLMRLRTIVGMFGAATVGAALAVLPAPAMAGSAVTPTLVRLASARETGEVTLWNGGTTPMLVEASAVSWSQEGGHESFAPTDDFVIAPAIVEVRPHSGQIFRVRAKIAPTGHERTYRLRLEDVTPAQPGTGVGMRIRHDLPLIVTVAGGKPDLVFGLCPAHPTGCLRVTNRGTAFARITDLTITAGGSGEKRLDGISTILAGSWHEWALPALPRQPLHVRAQTAQGLVSAAVAQP